MICVLDVTISRIHIIHLSFHTCIFSLNSFVVPFQESVGTAAISSSDVIATSSGIVSLLLGFGERNDLDYATNDPQEPRLGIYGIEDSVGLLLRFRMKKAKLVKRADGSWE